MVGNGHRIEKVTAIRTPTSQYVERMRAAAQEGFTSADMTEIVRAQVKAAKGGNGMALRFLTEVILGGKLGTQGFAETPAEDIRPGTPEKVELMRQRAERGLPVEE